MTFKETASGVALANRALGMISESKTLSSLDDAGFNAQAVRRWYKPVVARLLEMHHWGLATKRATPVANLVNDRSTEWGYSYSAPDDMAFPVSVGPFGGSATTYYRGLAGLLAAYNGRPIFQYHGKTIYSNFEGDLEYVSYDITEADFDASFEDIVVLSLASRLAREIPKDGDLADQLAKQAASAINNAITANLNAGNPKYGQVTSEAELARGAGGVNWDYIPIGFPRT
jgi:hypothetical protein